MKITVIGCGVIGLTTAIRLQEAGCEVEILTSELPERTVSAVAAAIWMPFRVEPLDAVNRWSRLAYLRFEELAKLPGTGISMVDLLTVAAGSSPPNWLGAIPNGAFREAAGGELPNGYQFGHWAHVPMIETPVYLLFLQQKFKEMGGHISMKTVKDLPHESGKADWAINCTGLAAAALTGDHSLFPIRGQVLRIENLPGVRYLADDDGPNALAYILPRKDCTVLGGTTEENNDDESPDEQTTIGILHRCTNLLPVLADAKIKSVAVGLRPGRSAIRLEKEPGSNIIHNYGHGGGGYTVSWGCAEEVASLIGFASNGE